MAGIAEAPLDKGEIHFYEIGGPIIQQDDGFNVVHDELEGAGIPVWDGVRDSAGSKASDGKLKAEMAMLSPLEKSGIGIVLSLGATIEEIPAEESHLNKTYPPDLHPEAS